VSEPAVSVDLEVVELLADEPRLLAIADAVTATQPRRRARSRLPELAALVVVVLGVSAAVLAALPRGGASGSVLPQALAVVGTGAVVHARIEARLPGTSVVDLATGRATQQAASIEYWYDEQRGRLRTEVRRGEVLVDESVERQGAGESGLDPALAAFVTGYRDALRNGGARRAGNGTVEGRAVVWLRVGSERVAIDARTYAPFLLVPPDGLPWRVVEIESTARLETDFSPPRRQDARPFRGDVATSRPVSSGQIMRSLRWSAAWLGESWRGLRLVSLDRQTLTRGYPPGERGPKRATGLHMRYAMDGRRRFVELSQAPSPEPAYGFTGGRLTFDGNPIPAAGQVELTRLSRDRGPSIFIGQLRREAVYVTIWSSSRELCLQAARRLRRLTEASAR
jgi:hypothetical protein